MKKKKTKTVPAKDPKLQWEDIEADFTETRVFSKEDIAAAVAALEAKGESEAQETNLQHAETEHANAPAPAWKDISDVQDALNAQETRLPDAQEAYAALQAIAIETQEKEFPQHEKGLSEPVHAASDRPPVLLSKPQKKHHFLIGFGIVLGVLYLIGVSVFHFLTLPNTYVNGMNIQYTNVDNALMYRAEPFTTTLQGQFGETLSVREDAIALKRHPKKDQKFQQNAWLWPISFFVRHDTKVAYDVDYDASKLALVIRESKFDENGSPPTNAAVVLTEDSVVIAPEKIGTKIDPSRLSATIVNALRDYTQNVSVQDEYVQPTIRQDNPDLVSKYHSMQSLLNMTITFTFGERREILGGKSLFSIYSKDENGQYVLDEKKLKAWVDALAEKTDTSGIDRKFKATDIGEVSVHPGTYGWRMSRVRTVEQIKKLLAAGKSVTADPIYLSVGNARGVNDIGDTYVEVDLSRQHLWAYKDGKLLVDSNIVSGSSARGNSTPVGVNKIWAKNSPALLIGKDPKTGEETYRSSVTYWMPIDWSGIGLHDADGWRSRYGGSIYKTNGSHGCVNLPKSVAKTIYENFALNTPVVIYESSTHYSAPEKDR